MAFKTLRIATVGRVGPGLRHHKASTAKPLRGQLLVSAARSGLRAMEATWACQDTVHYRRASLCA